MKLLEEPSVEAAQKFLDWQKQRLDRTREVQQLLRDLQRQEGKR
jgi:hypothetical protein